MNIRKKAMKGLAASIGFASESMSAQKTHSHPEDEDEQHEEDWYLDEAQDQLIEHEQGYPEIKAESESRSWDIDKLVESFIRNHPPPAPSSGASLPYPVILPQRRPSSRRRGFIRAYAPVLADCGIDQATFLDFLDTAERAGQARPWLYAINIASFGTAMLPSGISIATSIAVQLAVKMAMEVEGRRRRVLSIKYGSIWDEMLMIKRTNTSLDRLNDGFFRPRGLYCLVMTYKPETPSPYATFDLHSVIDPSIDDREAGILEKFRAKYQRSDGTTHGVPFPETAPLAFPELDNLQDRGDPGLKLSGGLRGKKEFLANYLDKRAQAQFTKDNPDSALAKGPQPTFASRYADPAHPSNEGSLVAVVSGGNVSRDQLLPRSAARRARRDEKPMRMGPLGRLASRVQSGSSGFGTSSGAHDEGYRSSLSPRQLRSQFGIVSGIKNFTSNILYLMIVNLPTEEEMAQAEEMMT